MYLEKISSWITSTKGILRAFSKNKRAMIGLSIIVFFVLISILASAITPYDPTADTWLAGSGSFRARPFWFKYFPGGETLSENFMPIIDPEFENPNPKQNWNITLPSPYLTFNHISSIGKKGSLAIIFLREAKNSPQITTAQISCDFYFPYKGPPARFDIITGVLIEDESKIPVQITIVLQDITNQKNYTWGFGSSWSDINFTETTAKLATPTPPISSGAEIFVRRSRFGTDKELASFMIPSNANYTLKMEITFWDLPVNAGKDIKAMVYIDTLDMKLYGTAFGLLGTDWQGRDIFSQLIYGARVSLIVGILSSVISVFLGLLIGLVSGYIGGFIDEVMMRFNDALLVLPGLPLLIVLIAVLGNRLHIIILVLGFLGWMGFARVVRSQVLSLKERPFIEAAKAIGAGTGHIIFKHIVPNVMGLVYVTLATSVPGAIVGEAALSWLGYYDPYIMSWGRMLNDVQTHHGYTDWWWVLPPGLCIAAISIAFILLGYALDEILNPRLRIRR